MDAKRFRVPLILFALALLTALVFSPILTHEFINYDDPDYITSNSIVQRGLTWPGIKWAFTTGHASNWHPLTWISHMFDCQIFGLKPWGHHLTNLLFHVANTLLLFWALRKMTGAIWKSALVSALFALHPLHVESVAWAAERKDVLSTFFWMLTMLSYARFVQKRTPLNYGLTLLFFALGLLSKPMLVTLPFVLLLLDFWPLHRIGSEGNPWKNSGRLIVEKIPFFALVLLSSYITFRVQQKGGAVTALSSLPVATRIENALISYPRYLGKMFWPTELAVLYPHPWQWPLAWAIAAGIFILSVAAFAVWKIRRAPYFAVGWFWFLGTLVPVIGLVQVGLQSIADRYTYIPLVGIFIAISWSLGELTKFKPQLKNPIAATAALTIAACVFGTLNQIKFWQNSGTLFSRAIAVTDRNFLAHNNLGYYLYNEKKDVSGAMEHYRKALDFYPQFDLAWNNLGYALAKLGRYDEAIHHYERALQFKPNQPDVLNNLGNALGNVRREQEAIAAYQKALEFNPDHADAHNNLGVALAMKGNFNDGVAHLQKAIELNPDYASAHSNLGNAFAIQGKLDEAIEQYQIAIKLNPDDAQAHNNLGNALASKSRLEEAVVHYEAALKLNAENPEANLNLGLLLSRLGKFNEARQHFQEALRLRPNYPDARRQLDLLLQQRQN